jgi:hypothetical protein
MQHMVDITLEHWKTFSRSEREAYARLLVRQLPVGFSYHSLQTFGLGRESHQMARFEFENASFVLIPGGPTSIGYDANRLWQPTPQENESWQETAEEYGINRSIQEHIIQATLRPRDVFIQPLLVETYATEFGWEPFDADHPMVKQAVDENFLDTSSRQVEMFHGGIRLRIQRDLDGKITAQRVANQTHHEVTDMLARTGFRLPASDEWEYICGGNSNTLFRWGDHVPCDRYPIDISPDEAQWRRDWVLSGGKLDYPAGGFITDWGLHRQPNNFGVYIASNPYNYELVAEPEMTRGGDGGGTICGGAGFFVGWLALATAYFEEHACKRDPELPILADYTIGRRVLPLI